jgi:hypothetical protein
VTCLVQQRRRVPVAPFVVSCRGHCPCRRYDQEDLTIISSPPFRRPACLSPLALSPSLSASHCLMSPFRLLVLGESRARQSSRPSAIRALPHTLPGVTEKIT